MVALKVLNVADGICLLSDTTSQAQELLTLVELECNQVEFSLTLERHLHLYNVGDHASLTTLEGPPPPSKLQNKF